MNLLKTIASSVWMIDEATLRASVPMVIQLMQGNTVAFYNEELDIRSYAVGSRHGRYYNYNDAPPGSTAIHRIMGTITKHDQYCGPEGTESLMRKMRKADKHENIAGHLLEIESGGGEATNIETVARFIRNEIQKPVVAWYNGVAASAAYYIAAAADEIYASEETDIVGSIGTMISFADFKGYFEKEGITIHEVYADQSKLKNLYFKEALEGNYAKLKGGLLNPYAERFIQSVKEFRPQLQDKEAFQGAIYMTQAAINNGMIDGQLTFAEAVTRVSELSKTQSSKNLTNMRYKRLNALLGYELEVHNNGVFLRVDELNKIEQHLVTEGHEAVEISALDKLTSSIQGIGTKLSSLEQTVAANTTAIETNQQEIKTLGAQPGATPTATHTKKDASDKEQPKDELDAFNAEMETIAKSGMNPSFTEE